MRKLFAWLKKKALPPQQEATSKAPEKAPATAYTEEEARKVKERLQGLGYID